MLDEMGMEKTIYAIALILTKWTILRQSNLVSMHIASSSSLPGRTTENQFTLIMYPVEVKDLWNCSGYASREHQRASLSSD